jgi:hypothetical protein
VPGALEVDAERLGWRRARSVGGPFLFRAAGPTRAFNYYFFLFLKEFYRRRITYSFFL